MPHLHRSEASCHAPVLSTLPHPHVGFHRRLECFHCSSARPANPRRVDADSYYEPSHVVKVSAIDPWLR